MIKINEIETKKDNSNKLVQTRLRVRKVACRLNLQSRSNHRQTSPKFKVERINLTKISKRQNLQKFNNKNKALLKKCYLNLRIKLCNLKELSKF